MADAALKYVTREEYLARESEAMEKSEYRDGVVYAMSGGSLNHGRLVFALGSELGKATEDTPCEGFGSEVKLRIDAAEAYYYPDAMMVCGKVDVESESNGIIRNPLAVFEVLSPGTQRYDQRKKFIDYQTLPSVQVVIFVHPNRKLAERYERQSDSSWRYTTYNGDVRLQVADNVELDVARLYAKLNL